MNESIDPRMASDTAARIAGEVRSRITWLFIAGLIAVALVFGLSFYFALLSNQAALARQVPELEPVAAKLKTTLLTNTLIFAGVIVASLAVLSRLVTARLFQPLGLLRRDLAALAGPKLPRVAPDGSGPFSVLSESLAAAVSALRARERAEHETLVSCANGLSGPNAAGAARALRELAAAKSAYAGPFDRQGETKEKQPDADPLFIQPL